MKIRCKNCYRVLNENEDYCTNCGEYSPEMAEYMKTGVRKVSLGEKLKISLIFFAFIAFLGTGVFSIGSSMIQGFISENYMLNVMSKLLTSMGLIIALAIVFRKDLYNIIFKDSLFITIKNVVVGVFTMIIASRYAPSFKKDKKIMDEISSLEEEYRNAISGIHAKSETKEVAILVEEVRKLNDIIKKIDNVAETRLVRTSSKHTHASVKKESKLLSRKATLKKKYTKLLLEKKESLKKIYDKKIAELSSKALIEIENKKAKSDKVKSIIESSNSYKKMFKEEIFVLNTFKFFASIIIGVIAISILVLLSTLLDFAKIIPTGLISFVPNGKIGAEFFELLFVLLLVSVCEEYIYRHHIINFFDEETMLNDFWTIAFSVIISTVLSFAWFMSVETLLVTFIINILMSLLYINTNRSLGVNIILRLLMYLGVLVLNMYI